MEVRTERDAIVEAIAWIVDPTVTGALARQPSSADTKQGSSSVVPSVSSDISNMPPGLTSPAASRANAADLIRGRGMLRPFAASTQTVGTAVSLLPPQAADCNNPSLTVQAATTQTQAALREMQQETISSIQMMVQQDQERSARMGREAIAVTRPQRSALGNKRFYETIAGRIWRGLRALYKGIGGTVPPPVRQSAARPPQDDTLLVDVMSGAASTSSSMVPDMSTAERKAAWQAER